MTSKVEDLFKAPAEELVKLPYSAWDEACSDVHGEDLQLIANKLIELAVKAARMGSYFDARAKGEQHAPRCANRTPSLRRFAPHSISNTRRPTSSSENSVSEDRYGNKQRCQ